MVPAAQYGLLSQNVRAWAQSINLKVVCWVCSSALRLNTGNCVCRCDRTTGCGLGRGNPQYGKYSFEKKKFKERRKHKHHWPIPQLFWDGLFLICHTDYKAISQYCPQTKKNKSLSAPWIEHGFLRPQRSVLTTILGRLEMKAGLDYIIYKYRTFLNVLFKQFGESTIWRLNIKEERTGFQVSKRRLNQWNV